MCYLDQVVLVSSAFNEKFGYVSGNEIVLKDKYENDEYTFKVKGIYNYPPTLAIFMPNKEFNVLFEKDIDSFSGYMSNSESDILPPPTLTFRGGGFSVKNTIVFRLPELMGSPVPQGTLLVLHKR